MDEGSVVVEGRSNVMGVAVETWIGEGGKMPCCCWSSQKASSGSAESRMENIAD